MVNRGRSKCIINLLFNILMKKRKFKPVRLFLFILVLVGIYYLGGKLNSKIEYRQVEKEVILDNLTDKINQLKGELVSTLQKCESAGYSEDDGILIYDTNKQVSIGTYQFQKKTVIYYYKTLYGKDITGKEAVLIALDDEKANQLASDVIFKTDNGLSNWYNCTKKYGLQGRLSIIKELEK